MRPNLFSRWDVDRQIWDKLSDQARERISEAWDDMFYEAERIVDADLAGTLADYLASKEK